MRFAGQSREELIPKVQELEWVHTIDLGNGVQTPGRWGPAPRFLVDALDSVDFQGKTVLDIGCWDGLWSFEAERRGAAEVIATDLVRHRNHPEQPTFELAHAILGSHVRYEPNVSVYDVARLGRTDFDIVLFFGVYYHLKHPLLALSRLRQVLREGGRLLIEGEVVPTHENVARFFYQEAYKNDVSNWWVPSIRCLREWVECSAFRIERESTPISWGGPADRHAITAVAIRGHDPLYAYPDEELAAFLEESPAESPAARAEDPS